MAKVTTRKLKLQKNFTPLTVEPGDEMFLNGIFEFNITRLTAFIKSNSDQFPVEQVKITLLGRYGSDHLDKNTVEAANVDEPIILAEISPDRFNVIDGNHRVEKARKLGRSFVPAYRVQAELHLAYLTSVDAYKAYVRYWNSKLEEAVECE